MNAHKKRILADIANFLDEHLNDVDENETNKQFQKLENISKDKDSIIEILASSTPRSTVKLIHNDRYISLCTIGKGGFGHVEKCYDLQEKEFCAVKFVKYHDKETVDKQIVRLKLECNIMKEHQCEYIVRARDFFSTAIPPFGGAAICMTLCGSNLNDFIGKYGRISENNAKRVIRQVVEAINYISRNWEGNSITHFDIKPENILLVEADDITAGIKVCDFGLSKNLGDKEQIINSTPYGGTIAYYPPEALASPPKSKIVKEKFDTWAIGMILYKALFNKLPFWDGMTPEQIKDDRGNFKDMKLEFDNQIAISGEMKAFITSCLTKDVEKKGQILRICFN